MLDGSSYLIRDDRKSDNQELNPLLASDSINVAALYVDKPPPKSADQEVNYESLDYEVVENTVYRASQAAQTHVDTIANSAAKWSVCFFLGVVTAAAAFAVNLGVENISGFKFWATLTMMDKGWLFGSYCVYVSINLALVAISALLTVYVGPAAAGSGIVEVKAYLNGIDIPGIFLFKTLVVKLIGSVGSVAGGLAIGKEGPFVHAGACIGALLSQGGTQTMHIAWFKRFWNDRDRYDMVSCGAAAGVAAAFRSPVGGVLFALEEMTSWWRNQLLWLAFFTTAVVSVSVRVLMKMCTGQSCGLFGTGDFIIFKIHEGQDNYEFYELLPMLLLGVIGGLLGSCMNAFNARLTRWRKQHLVGYGRRGRVMEVLIIALITSTLSFTLPLMFSCQDCPKDAGDTCPRRDNSHSGNFVSFGCTYQNQYNGLSTLFFNTQDDAIRNLFSSKTKSEYTVSALLTFTTIFYFLAVLTYGVAVPTGLFVPSILCGAAYGRLVGIFVAEMHPDHNIDEGTYALLGAASFLGGCMRMTVCTCVMLLELTNNLALLPLVMLVLLVAKAVGDGTGVKPIYELSMEVKSLPYLQPQADRFMRHITAREAAGQPAVTFQRVEKVGVLVDTLQRTGHNGFPVIHRNSDGESYIMGVLLRSHLLALLESKRCFQPSPFVSEVSSRVAFTYDLADFSQPMSECHSGPTTLSLTREQRELFLDLGPYVNPSYYVVQEDTSLSKVYTLFRTLGLRHLCVIPRAENVVGLITRQDLLQHLLEAKFMQAAVAGSESAPHVTLDTIAKLRPRSANTPEGDPEHAGGDDAPVHPLQQRRTPKLGSAAQSIGQFSYQPMPFSKQ